MTRPRDPVIRPGLPVDAQAISAIHTASWRDSYQDIIDQEVLGEGLAERHQGLWQKIFVTPVPGRLILVAVCEQIEGFIISTPDPDNPGVDFISALHVSPDCRGHGIGAMLMQEWSDRMIAIGRDRARLIVADLNTGGRTFYRRLGGDESEVFEDDLGGHGRAAARWINWSNIAEIGIRARGDRIRRLAPPASVNAPTQPFWSGAAHPIPAAKAAAPRRKQSLSAPFGLTDYGVNRVEIDPGVHSTVSHFHSHEDEFILVLEGRLTLHLDTTVTELAPGDCAGFPAGTGPAHRLENRGDRTASYLEIGSRRPDRDITRYPGEDLTVRRGPDGNAWFQRLDGTPLSRAD